ncbi:zinc finger BED domain-containing protein RICESLEEPER 1-like [Cynara cardunculus var. scolymus]|uniref:zinc finger BED domain-containing protein RICESLEEPER 1-like n=1 Tax=Cynara cardunculus var. scolymus TaxID=59895 RepID=UPI000D6231C8|nr:zinc finger BED domain-containing protein RICESLEEPER 1-like [Cynara cardunculus var. scolymus]
MTIVAAFTPIEKTTHNSHKFGFTLSPNNYGYWKAIVQPFLVTNNLFGYVDNASSNDAMVDFLKTEIDLDGLKEVDNAIIKVRNTVKYYKVLYYKKAFIHLTKTDANYLHCPTSDEWGIIERTFKFLKVFYEVTCAFSGSKYTTTNLYFANVLTVRVLLHKEKDNDDTFMKNMASRMYEKFEKYWANFSIIMTFAAVLDPRYKFQIVEWGYEKVYGHEYKSKLAIIKKKLFSLFNEYVDESHLNKTKVGQPKSRSLDSQEGSQDVLDVASASLMMDFDTFSNKVTSQAVKSELECYLEEKLMPRANNLNILDYWITHEVRYPTLARIARDILAIPISTVAYESAFSIGGRVLDAYRSSLKSSTIKAIICLRDWVYGEIQVEAHLEARCGAIMTEKIEDQEESNTDSEIGIDENGSQVA